MHIKIFLKKLVSISVAAILAVALAGCFDLGNFNDEAAYYAAFGKVRLVYQNPSLNLKEDKKDIQYSEYSIEDYFYNKNTGENFTYGNPKDEESDEGKDIPQLSYVYMAIPVKEDLNIDSVALYVNAQQACSLEVFFYVVDELPDGGYFTTIRLFGEPESQQKQDGTEEIIKYSDPSDSLIEAKTSLQVQDGEWVPLIVYNWSKGNTVQVKKGYFILLRFINNSGVNTAGLTPVGFRLTNLLIRAVS
jgi:hypothetical protein